MGRFQPRLGGISSIGPRHFNISSMSGCRRYSFFTDAIDAPRTSILDEIRLPEPDLAAVLQPSQPAGVDAHALRAHAVGRDVVRRRDGQTRRDGCPCSGSVALHPLEAVDDGGAPVRLQPLRGQEHVVQALADADVVPALVVPPCRLLGCLVQRRAQDHVLDRERDDGDVVRLHAGGAEDEGVGVDQARGQAHRGDVNVEIDQRQEDVLGLLVEIEQADLLVLPGQGGVLEVVESLHRVARRGLRDDHGAFEAGRQVVEDAAQRVCMAGAQLVGRRHVVRLDEDVFLPLERRPNLLVDRQQGLVDVLAPIFAVDERDGRARLEGGKRVGVSPGAAIPAGSWGGCRRLRRLGRSEPAAQHGSCGGSRQVKQIPA